MKNKQRPINTQKPSMTKTTMSLPVDLWKATKIQAIQEGVDAQDIVARALVEHLKKVGK